MNEGLPLLVSLIGLAVAGVGVLGIAAPSRLTRHLEGRRVLTRLSVTLALRIVTAAIFLVAAPDCRIPTLVRLVGFLEAGGALLLLGMGAEGLGDSSNGGSGDRLHSSATGVSLRSRSASPCSARAAALFDSAEAWPHTWATRLGPVGVVAGRRRSIRGA
jgi:hypothetical protein